MIAALPLAVVAELGSMLLPVPVFVMFMTGAAVKNLQTPTIVAFTVTVTLSLAWAEPAPNAAKAAATSSDLFNRLAFMNASPTWLLSDCAIWMAAGSDAAFQGLAAHREQYVCQVGTGAIPGGIGSDNCVYKSMACR